MPVTNTLGTEIIGAVFAASDAQYLDQFRVDVLKIFVLAAAVVFAASFIAVGMFSYRMVRPLREMAMKSASWLWLLTIWQVLYLLQKGCAAALSPTSRTS